MIDIIVPKSLRKFGYGFQKSEPLRRTALMRAKTIMGNDSVLFNMSATILCLKRAKQDKNYGILANDFKWLIKKGKLL